MRFDQAAFDIRLGWGEEGLSTLLPTSDAIIIVDVLSFSTAVSVAVTRGATVFPYRWKDSSRHAYAASMSADVAEPRGKGRYSLSPASMTQLSPGARIVLPSPNGSTLSLSTGSTPTFAGCLRNADAVAKAAMQVGSRISVIAAGERWPENGRLRVAVEDLLGAGAVIHRLAGTRSPDAQAAAAAYIDAEPELPTRLACCVSGAELIAAGYSNDVAMSAELDSDNTAPILKEGAYVRW